MLDQITTLLNKEMGLNFVEHLLKSSASRLTCTVCNQFFFLGSDQKLHADVVKRCSVLP